MIKNPHGLYITLGLAALNIAIAGIVAAFKIPVYLDSIGIVIATIILGWQYGLLCALLTVAAGFFVVNPYLPAYIGTAIGIVFTVEFLFRCGMFRSIPKVVVSGLLIALVSALLSAPITTFIFGGSTLSGSDAITAFLVATGKGLLEAVVISSFASEPVDKTIVAVLSYFAVRGMPERLASNLRLRRI